MATHTSYTTVTPPAEADKAKWARQQMYLVEHLPGDPIDPLNPHLGSDNRNWGIPALCWPPTDCVDFITATFKRELAGASDAEYLKQDIKFSIVSVCVAHFAWFASKAGAEWILNFYGIEELAPHRGYQYVYMDPQTKRIFELAPSNGINLRIFNRCERDLEPPVNSQTSPLVEDMKTLLERARSPHAPPSDPIQHAASGMYHWVSGKIRDWLLEPTINPTWPFPKTNRLSGPKWARSVLRHDDRLRYMALSKVEEYRGRAYRIEDAKGDVVWCGGGDISHPPLIDVERANGVDEETITAKYRCSSCGAMRCCVSTVGTGHRLCQHCIGVQLQKDERPALENCLYVECKRCPDFLDSPDRLINLTNHLNRTVETPVSRGR